MVLISAKEYRRNIMGIIKKIDINSFPKQYSVEESAMGGVGRKVEVCFYYKTKKDYSRRNNS